MQIEVSFFDIVEIANRFNLRVIGVTDCSELSKDKQYLELWQSNKYFAGMEYMARDSSLLSNPSNLILDKENSKLDKIEYSVISLSLDYPSCSINEPENGYGKIARYAWGDDYHIVFKELLESLSKELKKFGYLRSFTDSVPLLERALANRGSKNTFIGKNSMLIEPKIGSMFFIGEIICGFKIKNIPTAENKNYSCKTCTKCINACPTNAIVSEKVVDANKCISYLTIEHKNLFSEDQISMIGNWIFGCDICQEVCPFNYALIKNSKRLNSILGNNSLINKGLISIDKILSINSNESFNILFKRSPIKRTKRRGLIRNALAVALNQNYRINNEIRESLLNDSDAMVKELITQYNKFL